MPLHYLLNFRICRGSRSFSRFSASSRGAVFALVADADASPALVEAVPALVDASAALVKAVVAAVFASTTFFVTSVTCNVMFPAVWVIELSFKVTSSRTFAALSADCLH